MRPFLCFSALLLAFLGTSFAHATPVVTYSGVVASEVDGIVVNGVTYDVTFVADAVDSLFDNDPTDALTAADELGAALNATSAAYVALQECCAINEFIVEDAGAYLGVGVTSHGYAGNWQLYTPPFGEDGSVAVFTVAPTPEPSGLVLLGSGVLGLAAAGRRRIFARKL